MIKKLLKPIAYLAITITLIAKLPDWHYAYIRSYVAEKVVKITNPQMNRGGTGIHVKTPHGQTLILTNAHVCGVKDEHGIVIVSDDKGTVMPRRVIEESQYSDLCLVEGIPGTDGLSLGSEPSIGEIVAVIGHPRLAPTTVSRGELTGVEQVEVLDHFMDSDDPNDKCDLPKNKIAIINMLFFNVKACLVSLKAHLSNIVILPGNSGSPLVNKWGNLVGLAFAGDREVHWGLFITLQDIKKFIKPY